MYPNAYINIRKLVRDGEGLQKAYNARSINICQQILFAWLNGEWPSMFYVLLKFSLFYGDLIAAMMYYV